MDPNAAGLFHIAAIPFPSRGHVSPMLTLCRALLSSSYPNLLISFIVTDEWLHLIIAGGHASRQPPPRPHPQRPPLRASPRGRLRRLPAGRANTDGRPSRDSHHADHGPVVDFVVADFGLQWAAEICRRRGLPLAALWTQSAAVLLALLTCGAFGQQLPLDSPGKDDEALAYLPRLPHFAETLSDTPDISLRHMLKEFSWFTRAHSLLLSSSYELESHVIDNIKSKLTLPIYAVGPSIPRTTLADAKMECSYLKWLDSQPSRSVLYISLGSFLSASGEQLDEMIMGLNASGVRYLWVARDNHQLLKKLDGEFGMVVPWCDQLRVLCHPSVGGFLTHCGWNSTMEGMYAGVPMLTYPLFWDQYPNSKQIVDDWKIGLRLRDEEVVERVIGREKVARMVQELMDLGAEESKRMRERAAELKMQCQLALREGGSSSASLDVFVQNIICSCKAK